MDHSELDRMAARIARLEARSRRDRIVAFGVLLLLATTAQATAPSQGSSSAPITISDATGASTTLSSRGVFVKDSAGRNRVMVYMDSEGRPSVDMQDASGNLRQTLFLTTSNAPGLTQLDNNGKVRARLYLSTDNYPNFVLQDANEKIRATMFQGSNYGRGTIEVHASDGSVRGYLVGDENAAYFGLKDANQTTRLVIGEYTSGVIGMDVRNSSGTVIWSTPAQ